jgi:hypothetical protein
MSHPNPAAALNGIQCGNICSERNTGIKTEDKAVAYATHYDSDGWVTRRVWCDECGSTTIGLPTDGADKLLVEAVYWRGRLVGIESVERSRPKNEGADSNG